jgi:hypothetical protein
MTPDPTVSPDSGIDWTAIGAGAGALTALAALITAVVAIVQVRRQTERMRLELGTDNMWRLIEQWDSSAMRRLRARTAAFILGDWNRRNRISEGGTDILNLFELVGYLVVRSETLKLEDAWTNLSGWAISWWHVYLPGIEADRAVDRTILEDYAQLVERFLNHEAEQRELPREEIIPTEDDLRKFLKGEVKLLKRLEYQEPVSLLLRNWFRRVAGSGES